MAHPMAQIEMHEPECATHVSLAMDCTCPASQDELVLPPVAEPVPLASGAAAARVRAKLQAGRQQPAGLAAYLLGVSAGQGAGEESHITVAKMVAAGIERVLGARPAPIVRRGDVALTFLAEMQSLVGEWQQGKAFTERVVEAAKSPAAWLLLRDELTGGGR